MQKGHYWFSFPNFSLIWLSQSPFLGSLSMFEKNPCIGHLYVVDLSLLRIRRCEFSFDSISWDFPFVQGTILGSVSTFKRFNHGHLCVVAFLHLESIGHATFSANSVFWALIWISVFPITHPRNIRFNISTFMHGQLCVVTFLH